MTQDGGQGRTISGTRQITYVGTGGPVTVPANLSTTSITALALRNGAWVTRTGVGTMTGTFSINDVPEGYYLLKVGTTFYVFTSASVLDLAQQTIGRPDAVGPAPGTSLTVNVANAQPWGTSADISLFSAGSGTSVDGITDLGAVTPPMGATSFAMTANFGLDTSLPIVQSSKGDSLIVSQYDVVASGSNFSAFGLVRAGTAAPVEMVQGATVSTSVSLAAPAAAAFSLDLRSADFEAYASATHPLATSYLMTAQLRAIPGGLGYGALGSTPFLLYLQSAPGASSNQAFSYGDPYPSSYGRYGSAGMYFKVPIQAPGAAAGSMYNVISDSRPISQLNGLPWSPQLSPARNLRVNGQVASGTMSAIGTSPVISWDPPMAGVPDRYAVIVQQVVNQSGVSRGVPIANLRLKGTSVTLPPGILSPGNQYVIQVQAAEVGGFNVETQPFYDAFPIRTAHASTGMLTP